MRIFIGLAVTALAALMVIKTDWLVENFGHMNWAEDKMGTFGGTRLLLKLIGVFFCFAGLMTLFGLQDNVIGWVAGFLLPNQIIPSR